MRIDAHQHFWDYASHPEHYVWMSDEYSYLRQNFGPAALLPLLTSADMIGSVAVQAREMVAETEYLLALADQHEWILGVVGWLDLCDESAEEHVARYASNGKLRGLRMLIHDRADPDFAISSDHARGVSVLAKYGLTYDLLLKPQNLRSATQLADSLPDQRFVVDHIAKPDIASGTIEPWQSDLADLAQRPNVYCKLSSIVTQADWQEWNAEQIRPYLDSVLRMFGSDRLMIGSDWPVSTVATDYVTTMSVVLNWASKLSVDEQAAIQGATCARFYGLRVPHG